MAGSITVSSITLDSDNNFSIRSNTGATILSANGTGLITGVANNSITGNKIATGQITGNLLTANCVSGNNIVSGLALTGNVSVTGNVTVGSTIGVGNATPSTSGAGITFPATQSASSDANTLDDYEEGTWTPTQQAALTVVGTFSSIGNYTKIGRMVYLSGSITGSTSIAFNGGSLILEGLPFSAITSPQQPGSGITGTTTVTAIMLAFTTRIYAGNTVSATSSFFFNIAYQV